MFLRFSKGEYRNNPNFKNRLKKAVFLGDSVVMEYGNAIVGIAKLHKETTTCMDYDIVVASQCILGSDKIARFIKDMIGKSNKFTDFPSSKRRKYCVEEIDSEVLPIAAQITFKKLDK